ncbi:MAG TPA: Scr1 family TA system antitoxin-like transcriptional regulator [Candidatus Saccharimonadia bacterium]|nr:Scr1 family TA system antitoxin-like transcriptional regulator [Candidatus Saccharimonadia bacterium]
MQSTYIKPSSNVAQQIGRLLQDLRKQRHLTGEQLANAVGLSQSRISKLENGYPEALVPAQIDSILNILKAPKTIRQQISIMILHRADGSSIQFTHAYDFEADATYWDQPVSIYRQFVVNAVSSLVQTTAYREALIRRLGVSEQKVSAQIAKNVTRQDVLWDASKSFYLVMPEAGLYTLVADTNVQIAQLDRLERLTDPAHIHLGIIPMQAGMTFLETGTFALYDDQILMRIFGDTEIESRETATILKYLHTFVELDQKAYYRDDAVTLIRKASDHFRNLL